MNYYIHMRPSFRSERQILVGPFDSCDDALFFYDHGELQDSEGNPVQSRGWSPDLMSRTFLGVVSGHSVMYNDLVDRGAYVYGTDDVW